MLCFYSCGNKRHLKREREEKKVFSFMSCFCCTGKSSRKSESYGHNVNHISRKNINKPENQNGRGKFSKNLKPILFIVPFYFFLLLLICKKKIKIWASFFLWFLVYGFLLNSNKQSFLSSFFF